MIATPPLRPTTALAIRRAGLAAGVVAGSIGAHLAAVGTADLTLLAPLAWVGLVAAGALLGPRHRWRRHGPLGLLGLLVVWQTIAHLAMSHAPWLFGFAPHHHPGLAVDPAALAVHALAALVLALTLTRLERALERAMATLARAIAALARRRTPTRAPSLPLSGDGHRHRRPMPAGPPPCRGPPTRGGIRAAPAPTG